MIPYALAFICAALAWVAYKLNRLRKLENEKWLDEVYENAEKDISGKSLDELIADTNERQSKRRP